MHLSDLHFGRTDPAVVRALHETARQLDPHLVAVSGDLTQRARRTEFVAAKLFLESLPAPKVVVPGNHDVPLYNVIARFTAPLKRYRQHIGDNVEPTFVDEEIVVMGVNTARSFTFKQGRINRDQVRRALKLFGDSPATRVRIIVTHHPLDLPLAREANDLVGRAEMAITSLGGCLPDLLLAGHLHDSVVATTAARYDLGGRSAIVVQAGTATSTRVRGAASNSFNLLQVDRASISIDCFDWSPVSRSFERKSTSRFLARNGGWEIDAKEPAARADRAVDRWSG